MDLSKARMLLGEKSKNYSDEQLQSLIDDVMVMAEACCLIIKKRQGEKICSTQLM